MWKEVNIWSIVSIDLKKLMEILLKIAGSDNYEAQEERENPNELDDGSEPAEKSGVLQLQYSVSPTKHRLKDAHNNARTRPSEYLRSRCPLCFGGAQPHNPNFVYVFNAIFCFIN